MFYFILEENWQNVYSKIPAGNLRTILDFHCELHNSMRCINVEQMTLIWYPTLKTSRVSTCVSLKVVLRETNPSDFSKQNFRIANKIHLL